MDDVRTIGVIGGGQLGRMLGLAGIPMGYRFVFLDPNSDACAGEVGRLIHAAYDDLAGLAELAASCDVVTCEFENVPASSLRWLRERVPVNPSARSFEAAQDRLAEREALTRAGMSVADFRAVSTVAACQRAFDAIGPGVLKARRGGYDGKGQMVVHSAEDIPAAWEAIRQQPGIYERLIPFQVEASIVACRDQHGGFSTYTLTENVHENGILRRSVPLDLTQPHAQRLQEAAGLHAQQLADQLDHIGTLAIEFFLVADGSDLRLIANEFAPRVHNTGHWTIEGAEHSQFENHVRAVAGTRLAAADQIQVVGMLNCIGTMPKVPNALAYRSWLHNYAKPPRPGRKVGHLSICAPGRADLLLQLDEAQSILWPNNNLTKRNQ